ncbi:MAG: MFS transporter [Dehalococcoidales bacterium]|nr:MFS transporter [Dehalococcoidales bacterium]
MRKYLVFLIVVLPLFIAQIGSTAVTVAFPAMVSYFNTSLVLSGWVLNIYILVTIGTIPLTSKLSDNVGRRFTFVLCVVLFTAGSLLCSIAPNIGWLILFRAIQGVGGGGFVSSVTGIVSDLFPKNRQRLIGLMVSVSTFGSIAGPGVGGVMVEYLGWQSVFWLNVPFGIIVLVLAWLFVQADVKGTKHSEMDFVGIGILLSFASAMVLAVTFVDKAYNVSLILIVLMALLGIGLLIIFIRRSKTNSRAVFSREMLTSRPFLAANIFNLAYGAYGEMGIVSLLPLYAVSVYGMTTVESGLITIPRSIGLFILSIFASLSIMKWGYRRPIIIGTLFMAVGILLLSLEPGRMNVLGIELSPMVLIMFFNLIIGIGGGLVNPTSNNACIDLMPEHSASIAGLRQICRRIGQTIGIAICTVVLEFSTSKAAGFTVLFVSFTAMMMVSMVAVFWMPARPVASYHPSRRVVTAR